MDLDGLACQLAYIALMRTYDRQNDIYCVICDWGNLNHVNHVSHVIICD